MFSPPIILPSDSLVCSVETLAVCSSHLSSCHQTALFVETLAVCSVHPSSCHQMALCQGLEQCVRYSHHFAFRWCCVVLSCTQGSEQYLQSTHHFEINIVLYCFVCGEQSSMFSPPTILLSDSVVLYIWTGVVCSVHPSFCHHIVSFVLYTGIGVACSVHPLPCHLTALCHVCCVQPTHHLAITVFCVQGPERCVQSTHRLAIRQHCAVLQCVVVAYIVVPDQSSVFSLPMILPSDSIVSCCSVLCTELEQPFESTRDLAIR